MQYLMDKLEFYLHFFGYAKDERELYINLDTERSEGTLNSPDIASNSATPTLKKHE